MKLILITYQFRRDIKIDIECENCGHKVSNCWAYDDRNYWDNVLPNKKCPQCGKSTNDLGINMPYYQKFNFDFNYCIYKLNICPYCGNPLIVEGSCRYCYDCGWSSCS